MALITLITPSSEALFGFGKKKTKPPTIQTTQTSEQTWENTGNTGNPVNTAARINGPKTQLSGTDKRQMMMQMKNMKVSQDQVDAFRKSWQEQGSSLTQPASMNPRQSSSGQVTASIPIQTVDPQQARLNTLGLQENRQLTQNTGLPPRKTDIVIGRGRMQHFPVQSQQQASQGNAAPVAPPRPTSPLSFADQSVPDAMPNQGSPSPSSLADMPSGSTFGSLRRSNAKKYTGSPQSTFNENMSGQQQANTVAGIEPGVLSGMNAPPSLPRPNVNALSTPSSSSTLINSGGDQINSAPLKPGIRFDENMFPTFPRPSTFATNLPSTIYSKCVASC